MVFPIVVLAFCAVYYMDTRDLPRQSLVYANPVLYATAALALGVLVVFAVRVEPDNEDDSPEASTAMAGFVSEDNQNVERVLHLCVLTGGYLLALPLSFVVSTLLFLFAALYVLGERTGWVLVAYPVVITVVVYVVFVLWLNVPL